MVGVLNTTISFSAIYFMIAILNVYDLVANFIGYCIGFVSSFYFNRRWTFRSKEGDVKKQGLGFVVVFGICYVIQFSWLLFIRTQRNFVKEISLVIQILTPQFFIDLIGVERFARLTLPEILMQISGIAIFSVLNFSFNKIFTFKKEPEIPTEV